jgi:hypothetical protein
LPLVSGLRIRRGRHLLQRTVAPRFDVRLIDKISMADAKDGIFDELVPISYSTDDYLRWSRWVDRRLSANI